MFHEFLWAALSVIGFLGIARFQFRIDIDSSLFLLMMIWVATRVLSVIPIVILEIEGIITHRLSYPIHLFSTVLVGSIILYIFVRRMGKVPE